MNHDAQAAAVSNEQWRQAKALQQQLDGLLGETLGAAKLCHKLGSVEHSVQQVPALGRVALASSLPLIVRNKKRKEFIGGWLNYQISLAGDGVPLQQDGTPVGAVLHVAHWACEFAFEYDAFVGFPASAWQPWENRGNRLLWWEESESHFGAEWTYTLQLSALEGDEALLAAVVRPALALLQGQPLDEALPAAVPGLLRYHDVEIDGERELRVSLG
ncbi:hypothetical protein PQU96_08400 [Vogesella sp. LYT5W]|uniref:Uncharacterized protein n=1 Tax=Vogesella margarita TaxID=2984199 RepID=A0ABT5INM2_9NEIS|nr:hypothetical protein [Vogesella margarita]MDC7714150.1 hypothetical protein [Vogesella margarita]